MNTTRKKDVIFGKKDLLLEDEFDPRYGKERITILVDQQVVDAYREKAKKEGTKYQTLMSDHLGCQVSFADTASIAMVL